MRAFYVLYLAVVPGVVIAQTATNPWFGTWKLRLTKASEPPETLVYSDAGNGAMRMVSVERNSVIVTRFDGKPSRDLGQNDSQVPVLAIKAVSPISYDWTYFRDGKPHVRGTNTLSANRKSFMEVSWLIEKPEKTVTLLYDRQ